MKVFTVIEMARQVCKSLHQPGIFLSFYLPEGTDYNEVLKAAPYLRHYEWEQMVSDGNGVVVFTTDEEREDAFARTVGDEGPTKLNKYNGPVRVYALTISRDGELLNENT